MEQIILTMYYIQTIYPKWRTIQPLLQNMDKAEKVKFISLFYIDYVTPTNALTMIYGLQQETTMFAVKKKIFCTQLDIYKLLLQ